MFYEGGVRVPLFVRYPGVTQAGRTFDEPVLLMDFFSTLAEAGQAKLPSSQAVDSVSLLPVMRDPGKTLGREAVYFHFPCYLQGYAGGEGAEAHRPPWRATPCGAVRSGDWKLIHYFETDSYELFDLSEDPGEQENLYAQEPAIGLKLVGALKRWQAQTNAPVPTEKNPGYRPE